MNSMEIKKPDQRILFFTFSDFKSANSGDAINDRKLFEAIPINYEKNTLFPKYSKENKISLMSLINFILSYLKLIFSSHNIIITRGSKLAILPILLRRIFKHKIIVRLGCTPLSFVERKFFQRNQEFKIRTNFFKNFFFYIEPVIEKFTLRHADYFIVENNRARNIILKYGANVEKINIIPYYTQDYFNLGKNPNYSGNCFKIGYIGRFKEYDLLIPIIKSINKLKEKGYQIKLYLLGSGPKRKITEKFVKDEGLLDLVSFLGSKQHTEVSNLINDYHCLVLPMLKNICSSTIPIKILEGIMKGKIIITTNSGNIMSLFLNHNDLILNNPLDKSITEKIELVINNYEKYRTIAEELSQFHSKTRSKSIYKEKMTDLLTESIFQKN